METEVARRDIQKASSRARLNYSFAKLGSARCKGSTKPPNLILLFYGTANVKDRKPALSLASVMPIGHSESLLRN